MTIKDEPWDAANATIIINKLAKSLDCDLIYTNHAREQMNLRDIQTGDALHLLRNGFIFESPIPATREGCYKYSIEGRTPNHSRTIKLIVIPSSKGSLGIKIVTVMWKDET